MVVGRETRPTTATNHPQSRYGSYDELRKSVAPVVVTPTNGHGSHGDMMVDAKGANASASFIPRRRRRNFQGSLAGRLFLTSGHNKSLNGNQQSNSGVTTPTTLATESSLQTSNSNATPVRGGLRRDRQGNVLLATSRKIPHQQPHSNSPHGKPSRSSIYSTSDRTEPSSSFEAGSQSPSRNSDNVTSTNNNQYKQKTSLESQAPSRTPRKGAPLAERMDESPTHPFFPATSPRNQFGQYPHSRAGAGMGTNAQNSRSPNNANAYSSTRSQQIGRGFPQKRAFLRGGLRIAGGHSQADVTHDRNSQIRHAQLVSDDHSSHTTPQSGSKESDSHDEVELKSPPFGQQERRVFSVQTSPSGEESSATADGHLLIEDSVDSSIIEEEFQLQHGKSYYNRRNPLPVNPTLPPSTHPSQHESEQSGMIGNMLLNAQKWAQCTTHVPAALTNEPLDPNQAEGIQSCSSTVSAASTEVATNRAVDLARKRIQMIEQNLHMDQQHQIHLRPALSPHQRHARPALSPHQRHARPALSPHQRTPTRRAAYEYRKGQEESGDDQPIQSHHLPAQDSLSAPVTPREVLEQAKSILSVSDDESSRVTNESSIPPPPPPYPPPELSAGQFASTVVANVATESTGNSANRMNKPKLQLPLGRLGQKVELQRNNNRIPIVAPLPPASHPFKLNSSQEHSSLNSSVEVNLGRPDHPLPIFHASRKDGAGNHQLGAPLSNIRQMVNSRPPREPAIRHSRPQQPHDDDDDDMKGHRRMNNPGRANAPQDLLLPNLSFPSSDTTPGQDSESSPAQPPQMHESPISPPQINTVMATGLSDKATLTALEKRVFQVTGKKVRQSGQIISPISSHRQGQTLPFASPPRVSRRIPTVGQYSPDPVFCSKSVTSNMTVSDSSMVGSNPSFDSSLAAGTPKLNASASMLHDIVEERGGNADAESTELEAHLSKTSVTDQSAKTSIKPRVSTLAEKFQTSVEVKAGNSLRKKRWPRVDSASKPSWDEGRDMPSDGELASLTLPHAPHDDVEVHLIEVVSNQNTSFSTASSGEGELSQSPSRSHGSSTESRQQHENEKRRDAHRRSTGGKIRRWPPAGARDFDRMSDGQGSNIEVARITASVLNSSPFLSEKLSERNASLQSRIGATSRWQRGKVTPPKSGSSFLAKLSMFEKKSDVSTPLTSDVSSPDSRGRHSDESQNDKVSNSDFQDMEDRSVRSLRSAFESLDDARNEPEEDDDDNASVKSLREKFEGSTGSTERESGVSKVRAMFEAKTRTSNRPFQNANAELLEVFAKFQTKVTPTKRLVPATNGKTTSLPTASLQRRSSEGKTSSESDPGKSQITANGEVKQKNVQLHRPSGLNSIASVSVADRIRAFGSKRNSNQGQAQSSGVGALRPKTPVKAVVPQSVAVESDLNDTAVLSAYHKKSQKTDDEQENRNAPPKIPQSNGIQDHKEELLRGESNSEQSVSTTHPIGENPGFNQTATPVHNVHLPDAPVVNAANHYSLTEKTLPLKECPNDDSSDELACKIHPAFEDSSQFFENEMSKPAGENLFSEAPQIETDNIDRSPQSQYVKTGSGEGAITQTTASHALNDSKAETIPSDHTSIGRLSTEDELREARTPTRDINRRSKEHSTVPEGILETKSDVPISAISQAGRLYRSLYPGTPQRPASSEGRQSVLVAGRSRTPPEGKSFHTPGRVAASLSHRSPQLIPNPRTPPRKSDVHELRQDTQEHISKASTSYEPGGVRPIGVATPIESSASDSYVKPVAVRAVPVKTLPVLRNTSHFPSPSKERRSRSGHEKSVMRRSWSSSRIQEHGTNDPNSELESERVPTATQTPQRNSFRRLDLVTGEKDFNDWNETLYTPGRSSFGASSGFGGSRTDENEVHNSSLLVFPSDEDNHDFRVVTPDRRVSTNIPIRKQHQERDFRRQAAIVGRQSPEQKVLLKDAVANVQKMKAETDISRTISTGSGSEFSDGVTLDMSIEEVSGLTLPTALVSKTEKSASTGDDRDETSSDPSSKANDLTEAEARRSEASSSQQSEALAPLIARSMRLRMSDEISTRTGESFFAARAIVANHWSKTSGWESAQHETDISRGPESESSKLKDQQIGESKDDNSSNGWDTYRIESSFPLVQSKSGEIFEFDSEWNPFARENRHGDDTFSNSEEKKSDDRADSSRSKTPTRSNRGKLFVNSGQLGSVAKRETGAKLVEDQGDVRGEPLVQISGRLQNLRVLNRPEPRRLVSRPHTSQQPNTSMGTSEDSIIPEPAGQTPPRPMPHTGQRPPISANAGGRPSNMQFRGTRLGTTHALLLARLKSLKEARMRRAGALRTSRSAFARTEVDDHSFSSKSSTQFGGNHFMDSLQVD